MSAKLLKAIACIFPTVFSSTYGQFFVDFRSYGTIAERFPTSSLAALSPQTSVGIGLGARVRPFLALSLDMLLVGGRMRIDTHEEYIVWAELQYRLLLQLRYRPHPIVSPSIGMEWTFPFGFPATDGIRMELQAGLASLHIGTFAALSIPLPEGRYLHICAGGRWLFRSPKALHSAFVPEVRLLWESP